MAGFFRKVISGKNNKAADPAAGATIAPANHENLVELFENRNLLKRELEQIRVERDVLKADVEDLRSRHDEVQRQLTSVEQMLADPEKGQHAIIYYQLRAVWDTCRQQLRLLAEELSARYIKAEHTAFQGNFERDKNRRLDDLTRQLDKVERDRRDLRNQLNDMQQALGKPQTFWKRRKRESGQQEIDKFTARFKPIEITKLQLLAEMEAVRNLKTPAWPGINVVSKRTVNLALLALTQYLYLHFTEYNIADMARSAGTKPVADVNFGMQVDSVTIGRHIFEVVIKLRRDMARPDKLRYRTDYLRRIATYASEKDTIPEESCLDYIPPSSQAAPTIDADALAVGANVLRLNYWDIQNILLKPPEPEKVTEPQIAGIAD